MTSPRPAETPGHTPEPWNECRVPELTYFDKPINLSVVDYKRARLCVNALAGVRSEDLPGAVVLTAEQAQTVREALEQLVKRTPFTMTPDGLLLTMSFDLMEKTRNALALFPSSAPAPGPEEEATR